ncbi:MAG: serine/threonine protein kinase [Candidatus Rokubacteria bacterium]|nr:serine/threonine protein kinase [Candidatus Rokubacteria bacterium]
MGATGTGGDAVARELRPGAVLAGRYEVLALLGVGGMGAVYRVRDRVRGKDVALKVMLPSLLAREKAAERFQHEAEVALELAHENIVRVFDVGLDPATGLRFFTMELLEGMTLRQWLEEKRKLKEEVKPEEALEITRQVLEALRAAHEKTVHRDLKPENVFVLAGDKLRVKVLDFGIAKLQSASQFTSTSMALGTAYYMAPEQQLDAAKVDPRADLYSVCVILYEMLTGELPVGAFRKASEERKGLPPALDDVILRGLQRKPEGRPASADALLEEVRAIRALLAGRPARASGRRVAIAVAAVLLLAGVAALAYAWRAGLLGGARPEAVSEKSQQPPPPPPIPALAILDLEPVSPAVLPGYAITVRGRLSDLAAGPVDVGGLRQPVGADGRFEVTLGLRPGDRDVVVRAGSPPRDLARIAVEVDETPPVVTLIRPDEGFVTAGGSVDVEARVEDAHLGAEATLRVEVGGKPIGAPIRLRQESGRVVGRIDVPSSAAQATLILEASDAVGRTGSARRDVRG